MYKFVLILTSFVFQCSWSFLRLLPPLRARTKTLHVSKILDFTDLEKLLPLSLNWTGDIKDIESLILHEDNDLVVVFKPSTILTQRDAENSDDSLLDGINRYLTSENKPGQSTTPIAKLIHRLDRPCSGVIVFGKTGVASTRLSEYFRNRIADKLYVCVVNGRVSGDGRCKHLVTKSSSDKIRVFDYLNINSNETVASGTSRDDAEMVLIGNFNPGQKVTSIKEATTTSKATTNSSITEVLRSGSAMKKQPRGIPKGTVEARLSYQVLAPVLGGSRSKPMEQTLLLVKLDTGRRHQIRAQLAHIGHPIVGDVKYGAPQSFPTRDIALHALSLSFKHPTSGKQMNFIAPVARCWAKRFGNETVATIVRTSGALPG